MNDSVKISAMNTHPPNQTIIVYSNPKTGEYDFQLPQGDYQITYEGNGGESAIKKLDLPLLNPSDSVHLQGTVLPKKDFVADLTVNTNKTISVTKGDTIVFPMKVEPKSTLIVEHWVGDSLVSTEQYAMADEIFFYKTVPAKGKNRIVFKLTDKFNNTTTTEVLVNREKTITQQPVTQPEYSRVNSDKQIALPVLAETDPTIIVLKKRILDVSETSPTGDLIRRTVASVDQQDIRISWKWLQEFYYESLKNGLTQHQISELLVLISSLPDTKGEQYLKDLIGYSEEPLASVLRSLDLKKEKIKTPGDLLSYLFENKEKYSEEAVFKGIANLIVSREIPAGNIKSPVTGTGKGYLWILWVLLGAGILSLFLILWRKERNKKE
jgi:hypothetical protein